MIKRKVIKLVIVLEFLKNTLPVLLHQRLNIIAAGQFKAFMDVDTYCVTLKQLPCYFSFKRINILLLNDMRSSYIHSQSVH